MAAGTRFNSFLMAMAQKKHDLGADTLKLMLTNVLPIAANAVKADITEIAAGNGYTAGGIIVPNTALTLVNAGFRLTGDDVTITAAGGTIGPAQWQVLYNDTALNKELIAWWPRAAAVTLQIGEAWKSDFDQVNGILAVGV